MIINTRIAVQDILEMLAGGQSANDIIEDYPQLEKIKLWLALHMLLTEKIFKPM